MSAKDRFAEFRQERESADKGHTSRSSANRPVNFGDYEKSLTRIQELLQKHELEHEFKNKNGIADMISDKISVSRVSDFTEISSIMLNPNLKDQH